MSAAQDMETPPAPGSFEPGPGVQDSMPANWREALLNLIAARVALIQLESKDAARETAGRAARLVALVICVFFTWALLLAGAVAWLGKLTGWPWFAFAFIFAALHLLAALILAKSAKAPATPAFPITRAEFQKDREWIQNFQSTRKSHD